MEWSDWLIIIGYPMVSFGFAWTFALSLIKVNDPPSRVVLAAGIGLLVGAAWPITMPLAVFVGGLLAVSRRNAYRAGEVQ